MMRSLLNSLLIILLFIPELKAQEDYVLADLILISKDININHSSERPYIFKDEKNLIVKYNPISLTLGSLLYIYQNTISYQFSSDCLYNPSCSEFSKRAIKRYGFIKGCFLSADRLTRCNRMSATGINFLKIDESNHRCNDIIDFYSIKYYLK